MNNIDSEIQFTVKDTHSDGYMQFMGTLITPDQNRSMATRVYRKPIHTD